MLVNELRDDPRYLALIIGGSVAKGTARDDSDIDAYIVATDQEFAERRESGNVFLRRDEDYCEYPGGYVEAKILDLKFLLDAADHGSEPTRWSFKDAIVAFARVPEIEDLVKRIPVYPEHEQREKILLFHAHVWFYPWFVGEGEKRDDPYLVSKAATDLIFFAARLVLAHNKMLYPHHKWLMSEVAKAPNKPESFEAQCQDLLDNPSQAKAEALSKSVIGHFGNPGLTSEQALSLFVEKNEWNWIHGRPPVADW